MTATREKIAAALRAHDRRVHRLRVDDRDHSQVREGQSDASIAAGLGLTVQTVRRHRGQLRQDGALTRVNTRCANGQRVWLERPKTVRVVAGPSVAQVGGLPTCQVQHPISDQPTTSCEGCGSTWPSEVAAHCGLCHQSFNTFARFRQHADLARQRAVRQADDDTMDAIAKLPTNYPVGAKRPALAEIGADMPSGWVQPGGSTPKGNRLGPVDCRPCGTHFDDPQHYRDHLTRFSVASDPLRQRVADDGSGRAIGCGTVRKGGTSWR